MLFVLLLAVLAGGIRAQTVPSPGPLYSSESLVNAATNLPGLVAPNSIVSLYGQRLAWATRAISGDDIKSGFLPKTLLGTGTHVTIGRIAASVYYVSPTQVNLLVPSNLAPGEHTLQLTVDGRAGPAVRIKLADVSPGLFLINADTIAATRPDGSVVTRESPAAPGDVVVLYATGLGTTVPRFTDGELATTAAQIVERSRFRLFIDGQPVDDHLIFYVGVTPTYAGLYQINLILPNDIGDDPEIRIAIGDVMSPPGTPLPVRRPPEEELQ